jgi:mannan endo-1,4-beta-mannosidase
VRDLKASSRERAVLTERRRVSGQQYVPRRRAPVPARRRGLAAVIGIAALAVVMVGAGVVVVVTSGIGSGGAGESASGSHRSRGTGSQSSTGSRLPVSSTADPYFGVYTSGAPASYGGVTSFTAATGVRPDLAVYYSGWFEPFWTSFVRAAARHGALPIVQLNPRGASVPAIVSGEYDEYLVTYARAVRAYGHPIVLSFGHEMNGRWYPWGYRHTSPATFVAAWRHIVTIFREVGARNVTWMWTVNSVEPQHDMIPNPAAWWPGSSYVNWVGIDGYFHERSAQFLSVFGPTIVEVRELTRDPILISETGAAPNVGQPAKIASLFAGVRAYDLLGFVWFDAVGNADYRIKGAVAMAALRRGVRSWLKGQ